MLEKLCLILRVTGASHERICDGISRGKFSDFEDCLQDRCAQKVSADYSVTGNVITALLVIYLLVCHKMNEKESPFHRPRKPSQNMLLTTI